MKREQHVRVGCVVPSCDDMCSNISSTKSIKEAVMPIYNCHVWHGIDNGDGSPDLLLIDALRTEIYIAKYKHIASNNVEYKRV